MQGNASYWIASTDDPGYPTLPGELSTPIAVVGGGIVGLTVAYLLQSEGVDVTVLEAGKLAAGVSGHTTGKVTAGHGLVYSRLERGWGVDAARGYAESQTAALELVCSLTEKLRIDCDLERAPNFVFGESEPELRLLEDEVECAQRAGLPVRLERDLDVPFPARAAVRLDGQAQFHPRKYLLGLARAAEDAGARIFQDVRVTSLGGSRDAPLLETMRGVVRADRVVLATHVPITSRGVFFARVHQRRAYAIAAEHAEPAVDGMWINVGSPTRSLRETPLPEGGRLLLLVGEGHRVGQEEDTPRRYARLQEYLREHFQEAEVTHRWSTQDAYPVDGVPYIGRVGGNDARVYVATGFGGWGMTGGTLAGGLLADALLRREGPRAALYDAGRARIPQSVTRLVRENVNVAGQLVGGKLKARPRSVDEVGRGEGDVVRLGSGKAAVHRDEDGRVHAVSARCTHMGCDVAWNAAERTWDCPCHGSRFDTDGGVLEGPATRPLAPVETPELSGVGS